MKFYFDAILIEMLQGRPRRARFKRGFALLFTLVLMGILLILLGTMLSTATLELRSSIDEQGTLEAFYAADTAIECMRHYQEVFGAFNTTVNEGIYNCGLGADFYAGGGSGAPGTNPLPTAGCEDKSYEFTIDGFVNGACAVVEVAASQNVDDPNLCDVSFIAHGKSPCGGSAVERTRWERWTGLSTGAGNITSGVVGHWPFDELSGTTAVDNGGDNNGNLDVSPGEPVWSASPNARIGDGALQFDGADDSVILEENIDFSDDFTISAWIYPTAGSYGAIFARADACINSGRSNHAAGFYFNSGNLDYYVSRTANCGTGSNSDGYQTDDSFSSGVWHHVSIIVIDNALDSRVVAFYVDGVEQAFSQTNNAANVFIQTSIQQTRIGGTYATNDPLPGTTLPPMFNNTTNSFDGIIDDVRVYDRALNPSEIQEIYNEG
ncbi:LamG domain-containing protein [bacterium]|nr:LamG domain-containing protein [bacterium]